MSFLRNDCYKGANVLITGGTTGIGQGVARAFLELGANVTVTGVTAGEVDVAKAEMPEVDARVLDVRNADQVVDVISSFERLDHVVNCAGIILRNDEHSPEIFSKVVDINLNGTMRVCSAARPLLAKSSGTIVNMASMLSFFGGGLVPGYSASKGGVAQLTKSLSIAYADDGIRVNAVAPGWIETPMTSALQADEGRHDAIIQRTPLRRWGTPEDIAGGVIFLASPLAKFITGTVLPIDGGYLAA